MKRKEKISELISMIPAIEKPLLIYGKYGEAQSKSYIISREIDRGLERSSTYFCGDVDFTNAVEKSNAQFVVLDQFEKVMDNIDIIKWASKRKNMVLVASVTVDKIPESLRNYFTIKPFIKK